MLGGRKAQKDSMGRLDADAEQAVVDIPAPQPRTTSDGRTIQPSIAERVGARFQRASAQRKAVKASAAARADEQAAAQAALPPVDLRDLDYAPWQGKKAFDVTATKALGTVDNVFLDDKTRLPMWVTVEGLREGLLFVPIQGVRVTENNQPVFAYSASAIRSAPKVGNTHRLTPTDEASLREHFGLEPEAPEPDPDQTRADEVAASG